ncbi:glycosyltransferase [Sphingobacterium sp.]|uniref:glycosyltransferase family 2 protein n=1 Tax=Sphingobacterium sp. TaxID=341027 RepID=UPI0028A03832|nr:glycosyltransferase [Sphingobacterium sp.]
MKENSPLVSVYITNYNYEKYIKQSIESVLSQTLQDFELIIIDDGSIDNSRNIIEGYRDNPKVKIIYQQNKGLNVTNNIALRVCKGKFIMRLDADDFLEITALEKMSDILASDENLGLVFPDYYLVDELGKITEEFRRHNFQDEVSLLDQAAHGACTMIRVSFLRNLGGYNESFSCQDGYELWVKFTAAHKVVNITEPLFSYRRHGSNLTRNETRILSTRAQINELYSLDRFGTLQSLCIIPVRDGQIALRNLNSKSIIEHKIDAILGCKNVSQIVISCPDETLLKFVEEKYGENIMIHKRDSRDADINVSLVNTVNSVLKQAGNHFAAITLLTVEFPFTKSYVIDDAINTLFLFNSDSLVSVRQENNLMFQHFGDGMHPILNQDKFSKIERESLYKLTGGIMAVKMDVFLKNQKITCGRIGHVMVDQVTSMGLFTDFDIKLAELYASSIL